MLTDRAPSFAALEDSAGVVAHRPAVFERIEWTLADWDEARSKLTDIEVSVLDELDLTTLVTSVDGLSPAGVAAMLAQTGDLVRFTSARAVVKIAGLAPRERKSGTFTGKARPPAPVVRSCGSRRGGRCGDVCRRTGCTPPGIAI